MIDFNVVIHRMPSECKPPKWCLKISISPGIVFVILLFLSLGKEMFYMFCDSYEFIANPAKFRVYDCFTRKNLSHIMNIFVFYV